MEHKNAFFEIQIIHGQAFGGVHPILFNYRLSAKNVIIHKQTSTKLVFYKISNPYSNEQD